MQGFTRIILTTLIYSLLLCWTCQLFAQVTATGTVDSTRLLIGDQITLHLLVEHPPGLIAQEPNLQDFNNQDVFEVLQVSPWDTLTIRPNVKIQKDILLTAWDTGFHSIPALTVPYQLRTAGQAVQTLPIPIDVYAVRVDTAQLAPIKPILEEPYSWTDALPSIATILILLGLIFAVWRLSKRKPKEKAAPAPPPIPAHILANQRLDALQQKELWQKGQIADYHSELNYILRAYLEGKFRIQALESTTNEINRDLSELELVPLEWKATLREMLNKVDLIKFAKAQPELAFHEQAMNDVRAFVKATAAIQLEEKEEEEIVGPQLIPQDKAAEPAAQAGLPTRIQVDELLRLLPILQQLPAYEGQLQDLTLYRWELYLGGLRRRQRRFTLPKALVDWHSNQKSDFWNFLNKVADPILFIPILGGILSLVLALLLLLIAPVFAWRDRAKGLPALSRGKIQLVNKQEVLFDYKEVLH